MQVKQKFFRSLAILRMVALPQVLLQQAAQVKALLAGNIPLLLAIAVAMPSP